MNQQQSNRFSQTQTASTSPMRRSVVNTALLAVALASAGPVLAVELVPEAAARVRANERWQLLIAGKYEDAYKHLAPGFRAVQSYRTYSSKLSGATWTDAKAIRVDCNDERDKCVVTVRIESEGFLPGLRPTPGGNKLTTHVNENWIRQDGVWWMFPNT